MQKLHDATPESGLLLRRRADAITFCRWPATCVLAPFEPSDVGHPLWIRDVSALYSLEESDAFWLACYL